ncbi:MAG: thioredoxin [Lachnospiraceae bacterium]|nr:thioredoxin [Lachnospiraceae bacterium]
MAITEVTASRWEELLAGDGLVVVDFWASWCGPCRMMSPILQDFSEEHPEITVAKVNVDSEPELAMKYKIMNIPSILFFRGGDIVKRQIGAVSKGKLEEILRGI